MNSVKSKNAPASRTKRSNILSEYWYFLNAHKAWWLLPILLLILVVGVLVVVAGSQSALLMYTLF